MNPMDATVRERAVRAAPASCPFCQAAENFENTHTVLHGHHRIYRCPICGGYFLQPPMQVAYEQSKWTEKRARQWLTDVERARQCVPRLCREAARWLGRKPESVLEIGCGSGFMAVAFKECQCRYTGFDIDPVVVQYGADQGLDVFVASVEGLLNGPRKLPRYDFIIASNVYEHLNNPAQGFAVLKALCSGIAFVIVPNAGGLTARVKSHAFLRRLAFRIRGVRPRDTAYTIDGTWHNMAYTRATLKYLCRQSDLEILQLKTIGINDRVYGFVQPNTTLLYKAFHLLPALLGMQCQLLLVTRPKGETGRQASSGVT